MDKTNADSEKIADKDTVYTVSDLQKIISDERAKGGREQKKLLEDVKKNITDTYNEKVSILESSLSKTTEHAQALQSVLNTYEHMFEQQNKRLLEKLVSRKGIEGIGGLVQGIEPLSAKEQFAVLRALEEMETPLYKRVPRPVDSYAVKKETPIDRLGELLSGEKNK